MCRFLIFISWSESAGASSDIGDAEAGKNWTCHVYRTSASNPGSFARYADLWPSRFVRLTRLENRQGESSTVTITIAAFA